MTWFKGTQRIVSVNYLFGRPLIPSSFVMRIVTSNFDDMRNLMSVVFGKAIRPKVFGKWKKKSRDCSSSPRITEQKFFERDLKLTLKALKVLQIV